MAASEQSPWHAAHPRPRSVASNLERELLQWFCAGNELVCAGRIDIDYRAYD